MKDHEKWMNETLGSIDNIQKAEFPYHLKEKILSNNNSKGRVIYIRPFVKWAAAAIILILLGANFYSIVQFRKSNTISQNQNNVFYQEYFSFLNNL
jgi:hypothetical protein